MIVVGTVLLAMLVTSPGPLDRYGGHVDIMTGQFHVHATQSYQFRYVDAYGKIWEGEGPRPEENLLGSTEDVLWNSPFVPLLLVTLIAAIVLGYAANYTLGHWFRRRHYRRRVRRVNQDRFIPHGIPWPRFLQGRGPGTRSPGESTPGNPGPPPWSIPLAPLMPGIVSAYHP